MKYKTLPFLLVLLLFAGGRARAQEPVKAELDAPFALSVGETARLESEDFEVTLRSITDDSGCDDPKDCSIFLFKGTLLSRHGGKKELMEVNASFMPDKPVDLKFDGYRVELTAVRRPDPKGPLYTTLRVVKAPPEPEKKED
ncbi:MAG: hypothetical protein ACJ76N_05205 [Thermoanaerobaculia bacterium]